MSKNVIQNSTGKVKWEALACIVYDVMCNDPSCMSYVNPLLTVDVEQGNEEQLLFRHILELY